MTLRHILPAATAFLALGVSAGRATELQTWVAGSGKDSGGCTLAAPCATFQYAQKETTSGGTIYVTTSGAYGIVSITKPLSIIAADGVDAAISVPSNGIGVNVSANGAVFLKGLHISGQGMSGNATGLNVAMGEVTADHISITNTEAGIHGAAGFLLLQNSIIVGNGAGITRGSTGANVYIGTSTFSGNTVGIDGIVNSYGDNNMNGNTQCDVCESYITEVGHDQ